jgi:hypothetical protein
MTKIVLAAAGLWLTMVLLNVALFALGYLIAEGLGLPAELAVGVGVVVALSEVN